MSRTKKGQSCHRETEGGWNGIRVSQEPQEAKGPKARRIETRYNSIGDGVCLHLVENRVVHTP